MRRILALCFILFAASKIYAQQGSTCAQTLRLARSTYEQGRLHELPALMENCFKSGGFTKQEKVEAYRILTLAYIYLEEPELADQSMLNLIGTDHFFKPNQEVDPAEFQALFRKFRTEPIFKIGIKLGPNGTFPFIKKNYYVGSASPGSGKYTPKIGVQFGLVFEKEFFSKSKNKTLKNLTIAPEVLYSTRSFLYKTSNAQRVDSTGVALGSIESTYKQMWLDVNLMVKCQVKESSYNPYVAIGPGFSFLLNATNPTIFTSPNSTVTGPDIKTKPNYNSLMTSVIVAGGVKKRLGEVYGLLDLRYQYGLNSPISAKRTNNEATFDYTLTHNDFVQSTFSINIGVIYPYFSPKKLFK